MVTNRCRAWGAQDLEAQGVQVRRWQELIEAGRADPRPGNSGAPTDLCTIMYTSGTTGKPKARSYSQQGCWQMISTVAAALLHAPPCAPAAPSAQAKARALMCIAYLPVVRSRRKLCYHCF